MAKQVYRELQEQNNKEFKDNPSTVSTDSGRDSSSNDMSILEGARRMKQRHDEDYGVGLDVPSNANQDDRLNEMYLGVDPKFLDKISKSNLGSGGLETAGNNANMSILDSDYFDTKILGINIGRPSATDGVYDMFNGFNIEQESVIPDAVKNDAQSNISKSINVGTQFVGKTAINTVGGIVGGLYSVGAAAAQGIKNIGDEDPETKASTMLFDNSVNRWFDDLTEAVERGNTINTYDDPNKSWANNFFSFNTVKGLGDAASFITGAIASEMVMQTAGNLVGGSGLVTAPLRWARIAGKVNKPLKTANEFTRGLRKITKEAPLLSEAASKGAQASKAAQDAMKYADDFAKQWGYVDVDGLSQVVKAEQMLGNSLNFARSTVTSTFWEAGLEARQAKEGFIESHMDKKERELQYRDDLTPEDKEAELENYRKEVEELGEKVGLTTFGTNVALLRTSNMIQFPSIFGNQYVKRLNKATDKSINKSAFARERGISGDPVTGVVKDAATGKVRRMTLKELGAEGPWMSRKNFLKKANGKLMQTQRVAGNAWRYAKNPITEGLEEYSQYIASQSSDNYYASVLDAMYSNDPRVDSALGNVVMSVFNSMEETFKNKAQDEFLIGAIMGAAGVPMFKKGANGKVGVQMQGGLFEARQEAKRAEEERNKLIDLYDMSKWNEDVSASLRDGSFKSTLATNAADKADQAVIEEDRVALRQAKDDTLFNNVYDKLENGNIDFLVEDVNEIKELDLSTPEGLKEFSEKYLNKAEVANLNEGDLRTYAEEARKHVTDSIDNIIETYNKIAPGVKESAAYASLYGSTMMRFFTYSTVNANNKEAQVNRISELIADKLGGEYTAEQVKQLADLQNRFEGLVLDKALLKPFKTLSKRLYTLRKALRDQAVKGKKTIRSAEKVIAQYRELLGENSNYNDVLSVLSPQERASLEKQLKEVDTLIEAAHKADKDVVREKDNEIPQMTKVYGLLESFNDNFMSEFLRANQHLASKQEAIKGIRAQGSKLSLSDVHDYLEGEEVLEGLKNRYKDSLIVNGDSFKELFEESDIDSLLTDLLFHNRDKSLHQQVAGYLYANIGNPNAIMSGLYNTQAYGLLGNITNRVSNIQELIDDGVTDEEIIKEKIVKAKETLDNLNDLESDALTNGVVIASNDLYTKHKAGIEAEIDALLIEYKLKAQEEKEKEGIESGKDKLTTGEVVSGRSGGNQPPAKKKTAISLFTTEPNRLIINLEHYTKEQRAKYEEAVQNGTLSSDSLAVLTKDLEVITEEWLNNPAVKISDKEKFLRGFEAFKNNPDLLDSIMSEELIGSDVTVKQAIKSSITINEKSIESSDKDLAKNIKAAGDKARKANEKGSTSKKTTTVYDDDLTREKSEEEQTLATMVHSTYGILKEIFDTKYDEWKKVEAKPGLDEATKELFKAPYKESHANYNRWNDIVRDVDNGVPIAEILEENKDLKISWFEDLVDAYEKHKDAINLFDAAQKAKINDPAVEEDTDESPLVEKPSQEELELAKNILLAYPRLEVNAEDLAYFLRDNKVESEVGEVANEVPDNADVLSDMRYFVGNFRLNIDYTDGKYVKGSENEAGETVLSMFFPSVKLDIFSEEYQEGLRKSIETLNKEYADKQKEINDNLAKGTDKDIDLDIRLTKELQDIASKIATIKEYRNDRSNMAFRIRALKGESVKIKIPTVSLGDIVEPELDTERIEGNVDPLTNKRFVKEFALIGAANSLIDNSDDFMDNVVYVTAPSKRMLKNMRGEEFVAERTPGNPYEHFPANLTTGDNYYMHRDITGRIMPIKLNKGKMTDATSDQVLEGISALFSSKNANIENIRKKIGTFFMVRKKQATEKNPINNSISIKQDVNKEITVILVDGYGNQLVLDKDNFKENKNKVKEMLLNSKSDVHIGNLVENGKLDDRILNMMIEDKLLNTHIDPDKAFDKVYQMNEAGTGPKNISITHTNTGFDPTEDAKGNAKRSKSKTAFNKELDSILFKRRGRNEKDPSAQDRVDSISNIVINSVSKQLTKRLEEALKDAPEEVKEAYNEKIDSLKLSNTSTLEDFNESRLDDGKEKLLFKFIEPILEEVVTNSTNMFVEEYGGSNHANSNLFKLFKLKEDYPDRYDASSKATNAQYSVNAIFNQIEAVGAALLGKSAAREDMMNIAMTARHTDKIPAFLESKMNTNTVTTTETVRTVNFDEKGKQVAAGVDDSHLKSYITLVNRLYKYESSKIPINYHEYLWSTNAKKGKGGVIALYNSLDKLGEILSVSMNREGNGIVIKTSKSFDTKQDKHVDVPQFQNVSLIPITKAKARIYEVKIPQLTKEELDDFLGLVSRKNAYYSSLRKNMGLISNEAFEEAMKNIAIENYKVQNPTKTNDKKDRKELPKAAFTAKPTITNMEQILAEVSDGIRRKLVAEGKNQNQVTEETEKILNKLDPNELLVKLGLFNSLVSSEQLGKFKEGMSDRVLNIPIYTVGTSEGTKYIKELIPETSKTIDLNKELSAEDKVLVDAFYTFMSIFAEDLGITNPTAKEVQEEVDKVLDGNTESSTPTGGSTQPGVPNDNNDSSLVAAFEALVDKHGDDAYKRVGRLITPINKKITDLNKQAGFTKYPLVSKETYSELSNNFDLYGTLKEIDCRK